MGDYGFEDLFGGKDQVPVEIDDPVFGKATLSTCKL